MPSISSFLCALWSLERHLKQNYNWGYYLLSFCHPCQKRVNCILSPGLFAHQCWLNEVNSHFSEGYCTLAWFLRRKGLESRRLGRLHVWLGCCRWLWETFSTSQSSYSFLSTIGEMPSDSYHKTKPVLVTSMNCYQYHLQIIGDSTPWQVHYVVYYS
jgi:hypothetical protein